MTKPTGRPVGRPKGSGVQTARLEIRVRPEDIIHPIDSSLARIGHVIAEGTPREVMVPDVLEQTFGARLEVLEHLGMPIVVDGAYSSREAT